MADRILLRGGNVLTVDPQLGDIPGGDVLIEGDTIVQVGTDLSADAEVIDVSGDIVIPGFVDTHRHTWEAAIRNCAPNATLDDYFVEVLDSFAPLYRPEDVYASNLAGSLECINAGITTLVDWSHINNTPDHPDAGIQGLKEAGIRALYAYGSANTSLADYWFNSSIAIPRDDVERIHKTYFGSSDGLLTMGLATRGPGFCQDDVVREEWGMARDLGIPITVHIAMGKLAGKWGMVKQLDGLGSARRRHDVHPLLLLQRRGVGAGRQEPGHDLHRAAGGDADGTRLAALHEGARARPAAEPLDRRRHDRAGRHVHRDAVRVRGRSGGGRTIPSGRARRRSPTTGSPPRDMLTMATLDGAHVAGLEDRTGSLTPGKKADVVVIDGQGPRDRAGDRPGRDRRPLRRHRPTSTP